jgi:hypothetical protein
MADTKMELLDALQQTRRKLLLLRVELRRAGRTEEDGEAARRIREIDNEEERLISSLMEKWIAEAEQAVEDIRAANQRLQDDLRAFKRDTEKLHLVARMLGKVDEILRLVRGLGLG